MTMEFRYRSQVEHALDRPLTDEELVVVAELAALPPSHIAVIEQLYKRAFIEAFHYLVAVTDDVSHSTLREYVFGFDDIIAQRRKPTGLRAQPLYERELGRALTADETVGATALPAITPAQREVARALAVKDRGVALAYLHDLVPFASSQERQLFLESLPRAG